MKKVSYLVTVFNKQNCIVPVINALLNQVGNFEREVIIINDGSTDSTLGALDIFNKIDCVTIYSQKNYGPANALNKAFNHATGDYIKPMDGDDILYKNATQTMIALLEKHKLQAVFGKRKLISYKDINKTPWLKENFQTIFYKNMLLDILKSSCILSPSCLLFSRKILPYCYTDNRVFIQDYSLELKISQLTSVLKINAEIVNSLMNRNSQNNLSTNKEQETHDLNLVLAGYLHDNPDIVKQQRKIIAKKTMGRCYKYAKKNQYKSLSIFLLFLLAHIKPTSITVKTILKTSRIFRKKGNVRLVKHSLYDIYH